MIRIAGIGLCCLLLACSEKEQRERKHTTANEHTNDSLDLSPFEGKLAVGFVTIDGVYNSELMAPYDIFHHTVFHTDSGMQVFTVAPSLGIVTTFEGLRLLPNYTFDRHPPIDILVVPSAAHNMNTDLQDTALINFIRENGRKARYVLSLCDGAFLLAQAGLLDSLQCTTFPRDIAAFRDMFPHLEVHEGVSFVHDGKAITAAGGARSYDPAMYLVELLYGKKVAEGVGKGMVIDWNPGKLKYLQPKL